MVIWSLLTESERNELIAEKIFKWVKKGSLWYEDSNILGSATENLPNYLNDDKAALEKLKKYNSYQLTKMFPLKYRTIIESNENRAYSDNMNESIYKAILVVSGIIKAE
ncbi:hypothetical protein QFZ81_003998 [Paenibacillus sp. V4I9]|uniref:hypothetical protein n=1 Tax=Paenibacillus sp. V4I9 TaxID=3042308 RepID=UPI00277FBC4E|nr:hypothetical protein [Paenibacillus sp. V4I9]MDQ0888910.1 hypothetical protein [Paenibacillus sp. V4I9]